MAYENYDFNKYIDNLIKVMKDIPLNKVTILVGRNGGGKSFIRKILGQFIEQKVNDGRKRYEYVNEISMDKRIDFEGGIMRCNNCDMPDTPTSENTIGHIESLFRHGENRFLVIDEMEIGMGEELQAGVCAELAPQFAEILPKTLGILVITHSKTIVENLPHDKFISLEGMSENEWLNRKIVPTTPTELKEWSTLLYRAIQKRLR